MSDYMNHKLFEERQELTLAWMLELSEQCERAEHQISYLSVSKQGTENPNRIYENPGRPNGQQKRKGNKQEKHCYSCGSSGHLGGDPNCPARGQTCTQVKCQAGYRRDPGNPTQDPRWEWRDPALGGGIPPFPPGMKI